MRELEQLIESAPEHILHHFACDCAERALTREREAGREPDPRLWAAIAVKRKWTEGDATDEVLSDARAAARDVACAAALDTERAWQVAHLQALVAEHKQQMFRLCSLILKEDNANDGR